MEREEIKKSAFNIPLQDDLWKSVFVETKKILDLTAWIYIQ